LATINWPRLEEKWTHFTRENGALPEKMMDFTNFQIEVVTLARFNDGKIRKTGNLSIKWWMNHDNLGDSRGYTWIYSQHLSTN
jgi:hypothetical protein